MWGLEKLELIQCLAYTNLECMDEKHKGIYSFAKNQKLKYRNLFRNTYWNEQKYEILRVVNNKNKNDMTLYSNNRGI